MSSFTPLLLDSSPIIAGRLDIFRTQTLVPLEPVDKKAQAANDEFDQIIDSTIGLAIDAVPVADPPVVNSRAGLYIYIHSLVSSYFFSAADSC
jgi:mediator of RNA polymerase II transcription subunit 5